MSTMDPKTPRPRLWPVPAREATPPEAATPLDAPAEASGFATAAELDLVKRTLLARMHEDRKAAVARDFSLSSKLDRLAEAIEALRSRPDPTLAIGHELDAKIKRIADLVGQPPGQFDPRESHVGKMTAEEIADYEKNGTGIFRLIGQLASADRSILASVAAAAGRAAGTQSAIVTSVVSTSPAWIPVAWELAQESPARAIGVALALALSAVAVFARRLIRKVKSRE